LTPELNAPARRGGEQHCEGNAARRARCNNLVQARHQIPITLGHDGGAEQMRKAGQVEEKRSKWEHKYEKRKCALFDVSSSKQQQQQAAAASRKQQAAHVCDCCCPLKAKTPLSLLNAFSVHV